MRRHAFILTCFWLLSACDRQPAPATPIVRLVTTASVVFPIHEVTLDYRMTLSGDGKHAAVVVTSGKQFAVNRDGLSGTLYDAIESSYPVFSPDGQHLAYWAGRGAKHFMVLDGSEGPAYDNTMGTFPIVFSPDSRRVAHDSERAGKRFIVIDRAEVGEYPNVAPLFTVENQHLFCPAFSPDGKRAAWAAQQSGRWFIVIDGSEGPTYDWVGRPTFSLAGDHLSYVAKQNGKYFVVSDNRQGTVYGSIVPATLSYSTDGTHLAYAARTASGKEMVVLDGVNGPEFEKIAEREPIAFSADGKHTAYWAMRGKEWSVILDGAPGKAYSDKQEFFPYSPVFSPDATRLAYAVRYVGVGGEFKGLSPPPKGFIVVDGAEGKIYDDVSPPVFSADGQHVAYAASGGLLVVDGAEANVFTTIGVSKPTLFFDGPSPLHTFESRTGGIFRIDVTIVPR